jgi:hypothetical protein
VSEPDIMLLIATPFFTLVLPMAFLFAVPYAKRLQKRMEAREAGPDPATVSEMEQMRQRLGELEERVDFTERLLAQQREPERIPEGR